MSQFTLRGLSAELENLIRVEASRRGVSINKAIIALLEENVLGRRKKKARPVAYHDLDWLSGSWSEKEAEAFENTLRAQRKIDEEMWG